MKVFKFGGASVKDAEAVKNIAGVLKSFAGEELLIVVSAMGKTTNALENLALAWYKHEEDKRQEVYSQIKSFHDQIIDGLLKDKESHAYDDIENLFIELECLLETEPEGSFDCNYDQIVSYGEIFSTRIVSAFLNENGLKNRWMDARNFINTDHTFREGRVDWDLTTAIIGKKLKPIVQKRMIVTQGFIGQTRDKQTTTLGREGSDYSAAIFAYGLDAESVTIWKDVEGVMNADPKRLPDATLLPCLSYDVAIELAYYGATVIHPKTIQPLKSKGIPLYVKSFIHPHAKGTEVANNIQDDTAIPYFIFKDNQVLISLSTKDFSFIVEDHLKSIFTTLSETGLRVNLMQNSAISFSFVVTEDEGKLQKLKEILHNEYQISITGGVRLITVRNYTDASVQKILDSSKIVLEQKTGNVIQMVVEE